MFIHTTGRVRAPVGPASTGLRLKCGCTIVKATVSCRRKTLPLLEHNFRTVCSPSEQRCPFFVGERCVLHRRSRMVFGGCSLTSGLARREEAMAIPGLYAGKARRD